MQQPAQVTKKSFGQSHKKTNTTKDIANLTTENITTGSAETAASDVSLTIVTSGGTGAEVVKLLDLTAPSENQGALPERYGDRHIIWLKTQTDPSDVVTVYRYDSSGQNRQGCPIVDSNGVTIGAMDDGAFVLNYAGAFVVFVWNGFQWICDNTANNTSSVFLPQISYVPPTFGHQNGESLKIVSGAANWSA